MSCFARWGNIDLSKTVNPMFMWLGQSVVEVDLMLQSAVDLVVRYALVNLAVMYDVC